MQKVKKMLKRIV